MMGELLEHPARWTYGNDFLPVFLNAGDFRSARYAGVLKALADSGADFTGLSGSGSTCFGIFTDERTAHNALHTVAGERNTVQLTFPLAHFPIVVVE
jgi:4-diphosphocytidyl-2-C-methyl-D-erythritol kinase